MAAREKSNRTHVVLLMATIAAGTGVGVWGFIWWQDRPVRTISALLDAEEYEQAMRLADQFLVDHPHDTRTQLLRARAFSALGRHTEADSVFQQVALQSNGFPDDVAALRDWSVTLLHLKKWPRAASVMETLAQSAPSDPEILYRLSVARIRLRQYEAALESTRQLAAIPGHEDQANVMLGTIHHDRGNRRAALDAWV